VRKPVPVKFRHPKDSSLTWTGRGRKPAWVVQWLASGQPLTALVV
jgi:DNA-binding protein H-NS